MDLKDEVVERFLRYVKIDTQSDENSGTHPSTSKQFDLARLLVRELQEMGVEYFFDEAQCYVYAWVGESTGAEAETGAPGHKTEAGAETASLGLAAGAGPAIGFIAHLDTSDEASGANVNPQIIENYDGGDIELPGAGLKLRTGDFPELLKYKGQTLITSDGTTLLGADDKAGIAEIMTMVHFFVAHPEVEHGRICVAFTPDEEIGEGTHGFDIGRFGADFAYTVDGGELGELSYENFNAASARITVTGRNVHPGEAFGKMVHAARIAMEIESALPAGERPEQTKERQGFYHLTEMSGDASTATLKYILRDHDRVLFEKKKETVAAVCAEVEARHPGAKIDVEIKDTYYNMLEKIRPNMAIVERCEDAMRRCGIEPRIEPVRGGTDGAMLSFQGLPCPNICAGGHNFHGVYEYISCESMGRIAELLIELAK